MSFFNKSRYRSEEISPHPSSSFLHLPSSILHPQSSVFHSPSPILLHCSSILHLQSFAPSSIIYHPSLRSILHLSTCLVSFQSTIETYERSMVMGLMDFYFIQSLKSDPKDVAQHKFPQIAHKYPAFLNPFKSFKKV